MRYKRTTYYLESLESLNMADVPFAQKNRNIIFKGYKMRKRFLIRRDFSIFTSKLLRDSQIKKNSKFLICFL